MSINKEQLFNKCLDIVNERIENIEQQQDTIRDRNTEADFHPDFDQYGNKGEMLSEFEKNMVFLDRARKMKETLANLDRNHRSEVVRPGSVIETRNQYYFVSVPLGEIQMESGSKVYAISTDAPIYQEFEGKKEGDSFQFHGEKVEIVGIY